MRAAAAAIPALLLALGLLAAAPSQARDAKLLLKKETGDVKSSCIQLAGGRQEIICIVVYGKPPYLGFQFGAPDSPDSIAVTAGARRKPNSEIEVKVDSYASHGIFGDGFVDKEAEAILDEVSDGKTAIVTYQPEDSEKPVSGSIDLADMKAAIKEVEALQEMQSRK